MIALGDPGHVDEHNRLRTVVHVGRFPSVAAAVAAVGADGGGTVWLPNGEYTLPSTLMIEDDWVSLVGESPNAVRLFYSGDGSAIDITATQGVALQNLRLTGSGAADVGVTVGWEGSYTGYDYSLSRMTIEGFDTAAVHVVNAEHSTFDRVLARTSGIGFLVDNSRHTGGQAGISNTWNACRALSNVGDGWDVGSQIASTWQNCQAIANGGDWQFRVRGSNFACRFVGLDVEDTNNGDGLSLGGYGHVVEAAQFNGLALAVALRTASACKVGPIRAAGDVTVAVSIDSESTGNIIGPSTGIADRITDNGTSTTIT